MPREYCGVCRTHRSLTNENVNRRGFYECPGCGTRLGNAKATRRRA